MKNFELPRFIFLTGGSLSARRDLAAALVSSTVDAVFVGELGTPILNGITGIFYDCNILKDLNQCLDEKLPISDITIGEFYCDLADLVRRKLGEATLGQLALLDHRNNLELFDHFIYLDLEEESDVIPFLNEDAGFNPKNVLVINLGPMKSTKLLGPAYIWLPVPEADKQITIIEQELLMLRKAGSLI